MRAYKYRIYPNKQQIELMNKHFGCVRFVYNWGLEQKVKAYQVDSKNVTCFDLINKLKSDLKVQNTWLTEVNSQSLQMALRNLDNAFTNFFKKTAKFPKFKNKHDKQSFQCPQFCIVNFVDNTINLPKLKGIKATFHRKFVGKIKTVTISKTATNKFFASILVDDSLEFPKTCIPTKEHSVGIDLGIKDFAVLSTGEKIKNPRHLKKSEKKLAKLQRQLSKKKKGSSNRNKARHKVALLHEKIT
ncbi:MAG: transposase, partial [Epsilonproteobacteria bacterium]|nr:transposase [Campylobacterota bacterium]